MINQQPGPILGNTRICRRILKDQDLYGRPTNSNSDSRDENLLKSFLANILSSLPIGWISDQLQLTVSEHKDKR